MTRVASPIAADLPHELGVDLRVERHIGQPELTPLQEEGVIDLSGAPL